MNYFDGIRFHYSGSRPSYSTSSHRFFSCYGIQYIHSGSYFLDVNERHFEGEGPCAFLTYPGRCFCYGPLNNANHYKCYVTFDGPRVEQYLQSGLMTLNPDNPIYQISRPVKFLNTMNELIFEHETSEFYYDRCVLLLESLLLQLHEQEKLSSPLPIYFTEIFDGLLQSIHEKSFLDWDFNREARNLHITPIHFRRLFKQYTGMPPQKYLTELRLQRSRELLRDKAVSIREVGEQSGFQDPFYFSRLFKKRFHCSPMKYRQEFHSRPEHPL